MQFSSKTRVSYHTRHEQKLLRFEDLPSPGGPSLTLEGVIVIVENADQLWTAALGKAWHIPTSFFEQHASNPPGASPWHAVFGTSVKVRSKPVLEEVSPLLLNGFRWERAHCWHVDAISGKDQPGLETSVVWSNQNTIQRLSVYSSEHGWQTSTRISCWTSSDRLGAFCLILVDAPITVRQKGISSPALPRLHLRIPISNNRGGLVLPQMFNKSEFSLYECIQHFLSHAWHFNVLLADGDVTVTPEVFLYLVVSSTWKTNLQILNRDIRRISFEDLRKPTAAVSNKLHDRREDLVILREQADLAKSWIPSSVAEQLSTLRAAASQEQVYIDPPHEAFQSILVRAESLEKFLMDSFNLLISSTNVLQVTLSTEQAKRGQRLTQLAFVYIPLSFVTGIFGMNIKEINGSPLSLWVPVVALAITLLVTAILFTSYERWENISHRKTSAANAKGIPTYIA